MKKWRIEEEKRRKETYKVTKTEEDEKTGACSSDIRKANLEAG
jgi:hypothetical protein